MKLFWSFRGWCGTPISSPVAAGRVIDWVPRRATFLGIHQDPQKGTCAAALWPVWPKPSQSSIASGDLPTHSACSASPSQRSDLPVSSNSLPFFPHRYFLPSVSCMTVLSWHQFCRGAELQKYKTTLKSRFVLLSEWPSSPEKSFKERELQFITNYLTQPPTLRATPYTSPQGYNRALPYTFPTSPNSTHTHTPRFLFCKRYYLFLWAK